MKFVKIGRLIWVGRVMGMEESDSVKETLCTRLGGNEDRRGGRSESRWYDELGEDVARVGYRTWRTSAQSRQKWQKVTEEVKPHLGI